MSASTRNRSLLFALLTLSACAGKPADPVKVEEPPPVVPDLPPAICNAAGSLYVGQQAFAKATGKSGLQDLKVEGTRLAVVDFDNDGWPDLIVRRGGILQDDLGSTLARRNHWLLRNDHGHFVDVTESSGFFQRRSPDARKLRPGEIVAFADVDNDGDVDAYVGLTTADVPRLIPGVDANGSVTYAPVAKTNTTRLQVKHLKSGTSTPLSVAVAGDRITVTLATDAAGEITSTAGQVVAAVKASPAAALVTATASGSGIKAGTGIVNATADFVYLGASSGETSEILLNDGQGHFTLTAKENGMRRDGQVDVPSSASFTDVDLDGNIDLWVGQHNYSSPSGGDLNFIGGDRLYKGNAGAFTDVTTLSGLATLGWDTYEHMDNALSHSRSWSATACDLNGDGIPELMTASYGRAPNHLWQGVKGTTTTYLNRSVDSGYAYDQNFDWTDNQNARCYCEDNRSATGCAGLPPSQLQCHDPNSGAAIYGWDPVGDVHPSRLGGNNGTTMCADLNNDGKLDLVTTTIKHWWAGENADQADILINQGNLKLARLKRSDSGMIVDHQGVTDWDEGIMTGSVFDFDNDGWADIYLGGSDYPGNHGMLFHHRSDDPLKWEEVPVKVGIDHNRSHGIAVADFDRDGDLDVVVGHSVARCSADPASLNNCYPTANVRYFENVIGQSGNWVQLKLEGIAGTNRSAIGARVQVTAGGVTQTQEVGGGFGHYGIQNDMVLHFGLGKACEAEVTIRWPNKELTTQTVKVVSGYRFLVKQGEKPVVQEAK